MRLPALRTKGQSADGFALLLAILALMLLTFLGLTLALTTSTELQIASNYRWTQQALYNAEAGIEFGKALLRNMKGTPPNWSQLLYTARTAPWRSDNNNDAHPTTMPFSRNDQWLNPTRNWELETCDHGTLASGQQGYGDGVGYGVVLDDGVTADAPFQYKTSITLGHTENVNGAFTLWIRRPVMLIADVESSDVPDHVHVWNAADVGKYVDFDSNDYVILTSEGIAPFTGSQATNTRNRVNASARVVQEVLSKAPFTASGCGTRGGQVGGGPEGAGFSGCAAVTAAGVEAGLKLDSGTVTETSAK